MGCSGSKVTFSGESFKYANAAHLLMRLVDAEIDCDPNFKASLQIISALFNAPAPPNVNKDEYKKNQIISAFGLLQNSTGNQGKELRWSTGRAEMNSEVNFYERYITHGVREFKAGIIETNCLLSVITTIKPVLITRKILLVNQFVNQFEASEDPLSMTPTSAIEIIIILLAVLLSKLGVKVGLLSKLGVKVGGSRRIKRGGAEGGDDSCPLFAQVTINGKTMEVPQHIIERVKSMNTSGGETVGETTVSVTVDGTTVQLPVEVVSAYMKQVAPQVAGGQKKKKTTKPHKIHTGPKGGKYYIKNGRKVYM